MSIESSRAPVVRALLGVLCVSLMFLGSSGCGCCGEDDLRAPLVLEVPCCCEIFWSLLDFNVPATPWSVSLENADPSLGAPMIDPSLISIFDPFTGVQPFNFCISPEHNLGATVDIVVRDATNTEFARVTLQYNANCVPTVGPATGPGTWVANCGP